MNQLESLIDIHWLPDELIEEQKNGKLLFFCGAGISVKAGLPLFPSLVKEICKELSIHLEQHSNLKELIDSEEYDKAISYLENYRPYYRNKINYYLKNRLLKSYDDNLFLERHSTILELATSINGVRLVTTNFDNLFELAKNNLTIDQDIEIFHAPLIPQQATPYRWSGIVKLHGSLDQKRDNGIVLSSGDFGKAYLTEGWARRFVVDMFREFCVIFIGYSANDPIFRYIVDAINSEKQINEKIKTAYILLRRDTNKQQVDSYNSLKTIFYDQGTNEHDHDDLDTKLTEWLDFIGNSKDTKKIVNNLKNSQNLSNNKKQQKLIKHLRHSAEAVKYFCDEPVADIRWLLHLDEEIITPYLTTEEKSAKRFIIRKEDQQYVVNFILSWLAKNLDAYQVIDWLLENHTNAVASLFEEIKFVKSQPNYSNKYDVIIDTLLSVRSAILSEAEGIKRIQYIINKLQKSSSFSLELKFEILSLLKPQIVIKAKSLSNVIRKYLQKDKNTRLEESDITEELVKKATSEIFDLSFLYNCNNTKKLFQILNQDQFKTELANVATELIVLLKYTCDLVRHFNKAHSSYYTYLSRDFIKTSNSNSPYDKHLILVDLTINSLENLLTENPSKAYLLLQIMLSEGATDHPILFRIALYLIDTHKNLNINSKVELILLTMQYWLYEIECKREASNFIKNNWLQFSPEHQEKFWDEIRSKIRGSDNDKTATVIPFKILQRISWVKNITEAVPIPEDIAQFLSRYKYDPKGDSCLYSDYQEFKVQYGGSYDKKIEYTEFVSYSTEEHIKLLNSLSNDGKFHQNNNSYVLWEKWGNNDYTEALERLKEIDKIKFYPEVWKNLIYGLTSISNDTVEYVPILKELNCMSNNIESITNAVCWFLNKCSERLQLNNKDLFLAVFNKVLPSASRKQISNKTEDSLSSIINKINPHTPTNPDWYHDAINHEIGYITQALINFMISISNGKPGEISLSLIQHFNKLLEEVKDKDCSIYVKVILTSRLYALYVLLPEWTKTYVIPLLTWKEDRDNCDTEQFWNSYLSYAPKISKQLFEGIEIDFLKSLKQINPLYIVARRNLIYLSMELYLVQEIELDNITASLQNKEDQQASLEWLYYKLETSHDKEIIKKYYDLLKQVSNKLAKTTLPLEEDISYWIIMSLFSIPYTFYKNDWNNFWSKHIGYISSSLNLSTITTKTETAIRDLGEYTIL